MKTVPAALNTHVQLTTTTLATCWKLTSTGGTVLGFTDHPTDLVVSSVTYKASTGYTPSTVQSTAGLSVDNLEVQGLLSATGITEADVRAGKWDYASIEVFLVNWNSLADGIIKLRKATLGEIKLGRQSFDGEIRGIFQAYSRQIVELYSPGCRADLGDSRCGVTIASFTVTGTLTAVTSRRVFADSARTEANNYFRGGLLTWTGGANAGRAMEVKAWTLGTTLFELVLPMPSAVAIGDTYSVHAGCDKTIATCRDVFNKVVNFRGEPYVPLSTKVSRITSGGGDTGK